MQKIGTREIIIINTLLGSIGKTMGYDATELTAYKRNLIVDYTGGREVSTKGLRVDEAGRLIRDLKAINRGTGAAIITVEDKQADKKRKLLLHYAHGMMWETAPPQPSPGGREMGSDKPKVDMERVNGWCVTYGQFHKPLMEHSSAELSKLLVQFEKVYRSFLKGV